MILAQIVHTIGAFIAMGYYTNPDYFGVWSEIMMPGQGPPPFEFYYYSLFFNFIVGLMYAHVYTMVEKSVRGKSLFDKGIWYGCLLLLIGVIPGSLSLYLLIKLPVALIFEWAIEGVVISFLGAVVIAKTLE